MILPAQTAPAWYAVGFRTLGGTSGAWSGNIAPASGADEYPGYSGVADSSEAYPMPTGVSIAGSLQTTGDIDAFRLEAPMWTTSVTVSATPATGPALTIDLYDPSGTQHTGTGSVTWAGASGRYVWRVRGTTTAPRSYTTMGSFTCASGHADCDNPTAGTTTMYESWGGRYAGRLLPDWNARYRITLAQNQHASFGVVDHLDSSGCSIQMDVYGPSSLATFGGERMTRWRDGPAAGTPGGGWNGTTAGGHLVAPVAGTYTVALQNYGGSASCWYRFFAATSPAVLGQARPAW